MAARSRDRASWLAWLALASIAGAGCDADRHALLLTISATSRIETFDLLVRDETSRQLVLERVDEPVDPQRPDRDIARPGEALKVAVRFVRPGRYLFIVRGRSRQPGEPEQFLLRVFAVNGVSHASVKLVPLGRDDDGDGFPPCGAPLDCALVDCDLLDCDDGDGRVNTLGSEVCGNGKDDDCSLGCGGPTGAGDEPCADDDGDGYPAGPLDCDDSDPCRATRIAERSDLCADDEALPPLPKACLAALEAAGKTSPPPHCDDGIDQDCNGQDVACRVDEDCDGFSPPEDCDDQQPAINPGIGERCDGLDNNCNDVVDEGCAACDVDGDGHAAPGAPEQGCNDEQGRPLPRDDPDDYDAGVFVGASAASDGSEGQHPLMALRRYCSHEAGKNGVPHREVDHDGDGQIAAADGCPDPTCDADGDGFAATHCAPPKALEDCDDTDPQIFPGAPDRCGDGINQNCVGDTPCDQITDGDADGYGTAADCDDTDPGRAPWMVELCDGVDNDCDGLTDEGNPGPGGSPLPTGERARACNDSNEGPCGGGGPSSTEVCTPGSANCSAAGRLLSGTCACSRAMPNTLRHEDRVACPGEDLGARASPRCFGARPVEIERCDEMDHDCDGRPDDPSGTRPMVDRGRPCGTAVGNCTATTVVGCDLDQTLPGAAFAAEVLAAQGIPFNPHWVCAPGLQLPTPETCNGKDDDCDGLLPDDEGDADGDAYLACAGCTRGSGRLDLRPGLAGCNDCRDDEAAIFPTAPELCNGVDDNCQDGIDDDGASQCTDGLTCCAEEFACKLGGNELSRCGPCGRVCDPATADGCRDARCVCGSADAPCGPGLDCVGGSCVCREGGRCGGCCASNRCEPGTAPAACGKGGITCRLCDDEEDCTRDLCQEGQCSNPVDPAATLCNGDSGRCLDGVCCEGCLGDGQCYAGVTSDFCGSGGADCIACSAGSCRDGDCCEGDRCWDEVNGRCVTASAAHCGRRGAVCVTCYAECGTPVCKSNGSCGVTAGREGEPCAGGDGTCRSGKCCEGCWTGTSCASGYWDWRCGSEGETCKDCTIYGAECWFGDCW